MLAGADALRSTSDCEIKRRETGPAYSKSQTEISKLGVGRDARVEVKLQDKTKLAGYISEMKDESFILTDPKTSGTTTVAYADVTQVKGHNLSTGAKIAIGVGIGVAIVVIVLAIWWSNRGGLFE